MQHFSGLGREERWTHPLALPMALNAFCDLPSRFVPLTLDIFFSKCHQSLTQQGACWIATGANQIRQPIGYITEGVIFFPCCNNWSRYAFIGDQLLSLVV